MKINVFEILCNLTLMIHFPYIKDIPYQLPTFYKTTLTTTTTQLTKQEQYCSLTPHTFSKYKIVMQKIKKNYKP